MVVQTPFGRDGTRLTSQEQSWLYVSYQKVGLPLMKHEPLLMDGV